jgi:hypothetical protein
MTNAIGRFSAAIDGLMAFSLLGFLAPVFIAAQFAP